MKENILAQQELVKSNIATLYGIDRSQFEKAKSFPIGTIHNGFKKVSEGVWKKVSSEGKTAEEHHKIWDSYYEKNSEGKRPISIKEKNRHFDIISGLKLHKDKNEETIHEEKKKTPEVKKQKISNYDNKTAHQISDDFDKDEKHINNFQKDTGTSLHSSYKNDDGSTQINLMPGSTKINDLKEHFGDKFNIKKEEGGDFSRNAHYHSYVLSDKLKKSESEDIIEKGQTSDAFRYSDSQAFKIDLTGEKIKEKCESAIPFLIAQKEALKEIAQDALNQCEGNLPDDTRKEGLISYATFSYELREPKRDQYSNTYPERSDCQKQMDRYNSAIYQMLDINSDIKVLHTLANTLTDEKLYSLTLNQVVAISMGYTEDELAEKAIEPEIEKGGVGSGKHKGLQINHDKEGLKLHKTLKKYYDNDELKNSSDDDLKDAVENAHSDKSQDDKNKIKEALHNHIHSY